jgi:septum formation protein
VDNLILASASPTRAKILNTHDIKFRQISVDFNEDSIKIKSAKDFVYHATKGKLDRYMQMYDVSTPVLCADTVVSADDKILRKAKDIDDARDILLRQSGNSVSILTCMMFKSKKMEFIDLSVTKYQFYEFEKQKIELYLKSGEYKDKAGACMVEGFCKQFIKSVIGLQSTAMGLSVEKLIPILKLNDAIL